MLSRKIRSKIVKTIHKLTIQSLGNDLTVNMDMNMKLSKICLADYCRMYTISLRVTEFSQLL